MGKSDLCLPESYFIVAKVLMAALLVVFMMWGLPSCSHGSSGDIGDDSETRYFGISGGGGTSGTTPSVSSGSSSATGAAGGGTSPTPAPTPTPVPALPVSMKTGSSIRAILSGLGASVDGANLSFAASSSAPPAGAATQLLSDVSASSPTEVLAWKDGATIKYYAQGYTDSGRKIPLNANSARMFSNCKGLSSIEVSGFDTSEVTTMKWMFNYCENLITLDLSGFNTSNVTDMFGMFQECENLTSLNVLSFDTSKVTDMSQMFDFCRRLRELDLSSFDTGNVEDMHFMFAAVERLETIYVSTSFVTTKVITTPGGDQGINVFTSVDRLVGGQGTSYQYGVSSLNVDWARIDDAANGNPGWFTLKTNP